MARAPQSSTSNQAVGDRLRLIRLAYGVLQKRAKPMSQSEIARLCGIGISAWNNAETGDNRIGLDAAMNITKATGVGLSYIFFGNRIDLPHPFAVEIDKLERQATAKRA